jgi:hypothetical protein
LTGCPTGITDITEEDDTWSELISLSQAHGTWKASYNQTRAINELIKSITGAPLDAQEEAMIAFLLGDIKTTSYTDMTLTIDADARTMTASEATTITFSDGNINTVWLLLKDAPASGGNVTINEESYSLTVTQPQFAQPVTDDDWKEALSWGVEINQNRTKIKIPGEKLRKGVPELIFVKQDGPAYQIPALSGSVGVDGAVKAGALLTANTAKLNGAGTISYQWQSAHTADGSFVNIEDAIGGAYIPASVDEGKYIRVTVTRTGYSDSVSATVGPVVKEEPSVWSKITSLSQINGTWRGFYIQTQTLKETLESEGELDAHTAAMLGNIKVTSYTDIITIIDADAKTMAASGTTTMTFSGSNIDITWLILKMILASKDDVTVNDETHSIAMSIDQPERPVTDNDLKEILDGGVEINQDGTKIKIVAKKTDSSVPELIFTKQR